MLGNGEIKNIKVYDRYTVVLSPNCGSIIQIYLNILPHLSTLLMKVLSESAAADAGCVDTNIMKPDKFGSIDRAVLIIHCFFASINRMDLMSRPLSIVMD